MRIHIYITQVLYIYAISRPMDNNDDPSSFKHSWKIEHFEHLLAKATCNRRFYSDVFFSPGIKTSDPSLPWRLSVIPKPGLSLNTIDAHLESIPPPAELKDNTRVRRTKFQIKVF